MSEARRPIPARTAAVERWALPDVAGPVISRVREEKKAPVDNTVELLRQALQESEARGYQADPATEMATS